MGVFVDVWLVVGSGWGLGKRLEDEELEQKLQWVESDYVLLTVHHGVFAPQQYPKAGHKSATLHCYRF